MQSNSTALRQIPIDAMFIMFRLCECVGGEVPEDLYKGVSNILTISECQSPVTLLSQLPWR